MRVAALVALTGCWSTTTVAPAAAVEQGVVVSTGGTAGGFSGPTTKPRAAFPLHSVWEGTYVCSQGLSFVRLTIDAQRNGVVSARYDFGATPQNTSVPTGAYSMKGTIQPSSHGFLAELEPDEWIDHPSGYVSVSLSIETTNRDMTGTIHHDSCSNFVAQRID